MAEVFEVDHFLAVAIQIIDNVVAVHDVDEVQVKLVPDGIDEGKQVLLLLHGAVLVALLINEPGDLGVGRGSANLLGADARGTDEIRPPMIVRLLFVFFPDHERRAADEEDVFAVRGRGGGRLAREEKTQENKKREQSFHRNGWEQYLCWDRTCCNSAIFSFRAHARARARNR